MTVQNLVALHLDEWVCPSDGGGPAGTTLTSTGPKSVVMVEDSPSDAVVFHAMLAETFGEYECFRGSNLSEGLSLIEEVTPACVLLDLGLPDSNGMGTLDAVTDRFPSVPVVVLTGYDDDSLGEMAVRQGAQDYLVKGSTDSQLLLRAVRYAIERKGAAICAARKESRFRSLLDVSPDAVIACDAADRITFWNNGAQAIYGWSPDEAVGQSIEDLLSPEGCAGEAGTPAATDRWETESEHVTRSGQLIAVEGRWSVLRDENGLVIGRIGANRDVTCRRHMEEQLGRSNAELEQFAYVASHDLSEPLRTVAGFIQLLAHRYKGQLDPEADEFIDFTLGGVKRMQRLIQDLLEYSRVSRLEYTLEPLDVGQLVAEVLAALGAGGSVTLGSELPVVCADGGQLRRVFQNLIANGLKFAAPDRPAHVEVSATSDGTYWTFSVRDNGIGIAPEHHERVFKMFQRLHSEDDYAGTGIGLPICQRIVERHGGTIGLDSTEGEGSTFRFTIPVRD